MKNEKITVSDSVVDSLIRLITLLIRTHPNPKPVLEVAIKSFQDYRDNLELVVTVLEEELIAKEKGSKKDRE